MIRLRILGNMSEDLEAKERYQKEISAFSNINVTMELDFPWLFSAFDW